MRDVRGAVAVFCVAASVGACQLFGGLGGLEFRGGRGLGGAGGSTPSAGGSPSTGGGGAAVSTASSSSASSASSSSASSSGSGGSGLDPALDVPDPSGMSCMGYGGQGDCPSLTVCRIATKHGGRCEGCTACDNLGAPCSASSDCDILFQCFRGQCTNFCQLGSTECGSPTNCIDVGNDTEGVCWPPP
ncbi:MAG TPA: hypothetical protein VHB21_01250 [Minicystis sp.]|nr:hypothetical protein [Minicystis sp.]